MSESQPDTCSLAGRHCVPCQGGIPPLKGAPLQALLSQLGGNWTLVDEHHLTCDYAFRNFREALAFVNRVGALADEQDHHPEIHLTWGKVRVTIWTHKIDGLTESDFIFAAKTDALVAA